ncbi:MAG: hypothetical protein MR454_03155, partial [Solobacterium sp.]|nr:hypothetical protein [Solobacterium sp.]
NNRRKGETSMPKTIQELLKEYDKQMTSNEDSENGKAYDYYGDGNGCICCPMDGDTQFECCQYGVCLACLSM